MNTHAFSPRARVSLMPNLRERHHSWFLAAIAMAALTLMCAVLFSVDDRMLNGVSVWTKPFKFSLSLAVYFATLAWFAPMLAKGYFRTPKGRVLTWLPIGCAIFEMTYIILQAALGQHSHFNVTTPFHATMYSLMGGGATLLVAVCLWMGAAILREHGWHDPLVVAVGLGLILTFVVGGGFGGYLGSQASHWVGGTQSDAGGMMLVKWSQDGGDLRVAHFFGMHAMQVLPMLAALIPAALTRRAAITLVIVMTTAYAGLTTWTFVQAITGVPFLG